jgi:hypothetical protein
MNQQLAIIVRLFREAAVEAGQIPLPPVGRRNDRDLQDRISVARL